MVSPWCPTMTRPPSSHVLRYDTTQINAPTHHLVTQCASAFPTLSSQSIAFDLAGVAYGPASASPLSLIKRSANLTSGATVTCSSFPQVSLSGPDYPIPLSIHHYLPSLLLFLSIVMIYRSLSVSLSCCFACHFCLMTVCM